MIDKSKIEKKGCLVEGCDRKLHGSFYCNMHYDRKLYTGTPGQLEPLVDTGKSLQEKLLSHRKITETGCWEWTRSRNRKEYGTINHDNKSLLVHRASASIFLNFDVNSKLVICHHCDNPPCFNPAHLFIGTRKDNALDMIKKKRPRRPYCGENHHLAKLRTNDIVIIRNLREKGVLCIEIAKKFKVHPNNIRDICRRNTWKHVK